MNTAIAITNQRNQNGVKDSCDQYRTINGEHWIDWTWDFNDEIIAKYRAAGVRVRVIKGEMYIRHADMEKAKQVNH
jgi:hypothetical protein